MFLIGDFSNDIDPIERDLFCADFAIYNPAMEIWRANTFIENGKILLNTKEKDTQ